MYSGGQSKSNHKLHNAVVDLAKQEKKSRKLQLTYIPFCADNAHVFYERAIRRYRSHGIERFFCMPVDGPLTKHEIEVALESDVIYLAGGNTFYFLKHLRASGMLEKLKTFAKKGGVLAGLSAGALIMSPTTKLAADKSLGPDPNDVGIKDFKGMNLFGFEFSPHFHPTKKQITAHRTYSLKTPNPVFASEDGGGVIINGDDIRMCGKGMFFYQGTTIHLG